MLCIQCLVGFLHGWGQSASNSLHPPQHTPRLLHYGPCRHRELYRYSRWHPVPPNSYQPKSRLTASYSPKKLTRVTNLDPGTRSSVNSQNCTAATLSSECSTNIHIDSSYWNWLLSFLLFFIVQVAFWQLDILNEDDDDDDENFAKNALALTHSVAQ